MSRLAVPLSRYLLPRLALAAGALLLALVGAELYLRLRQGLGYEFMFSDGAIGYDRSIYAEDPLLVDVLAPDSQGVMRTAEFRTVVRINALGTRGPHPGPPRQDQLRLLAVGDSFTLGEQVEHEQTFAARLGDGLSERLGREVLLLNAGVDGYGTEQASLLAERLLEPTGAQGVLLTFFLGNDFWDNLNYRPRTGPGLPPEPSSWLHRLLWRHSMLYVYYGLYEQWAEVQRHPERPNRHRDEMRVFTSGGDLNRYMNHTRRALDGFERLCQQRQLSCFVAMAPPIFAVDEARARASFERFGLDAEQIDLDRPARELERAMPPGLPVLDLSPALRSAAAEGEQLYFTLDGHWTAAGHRMAAEALEDFMAPRLQGGQGN